MSTRPTVRLLAVLAALLLLAGLAQAAPQDEGAMAVEAEICAACHEDLVTSFTGPHAALDREGGPLAGSLSCSGCHGDPSEHLEAGGGVENIFSFGDENPFTVNAQRCQECHGDTHPGFFRSPHAQAGMSCQDCHSVHSPDPDSWAMLKSSGGGVERPMENLSAATRSCQECHGEVFAQFEFNERHRLREGILDCQSCHDPHDAANRAQLGGFKQAACAECHADKEGPFVFEHGSSIVEGCVACHAPHGSPNRHMLKIQEVGALCYSCHAAVPGFHARFTLETNCTNCHSTIHGSNFDRFFLK